MNPSQSPKKYKTRLFLGEGNFSFTAAFLKKHEAKEGLAQFITPTVFESRKELWDKHAKVLHASMPILAKKKNQPCQKNILYNVDARKLHEHPNLKDKRFQRIHFNCPHDGSNTMKSSDLPLMLKNFFQSAKLMQHNGDKIHMALPCEHIEYKREFREGYIYGIFLASANAGYKLISKRKFGSSRYPGYVHTETNTAKPHALSMSDELREYVFEKTTLSYKDICKLTPPHLGLVRNKKTNQKAKLICLPKMDTCSDSSDGENSDDSKDDLSLTDTTYLPSVSSSPISMPLTPYFSGLRQIYNDFPSPAKSPSKP